MNWQTEFSPSYSILKVELEPNEEIFAEAGTFLMYKGNIKIDTTMQGGFLKSIARTFLGGESLFINKLTALSKSEVYLAPSLPGDVIHIPLKNQEFIVYDGCYLAHSGNLEISVKWKGLKGLLAGKQLVWLKISGSGDLFLNSFGAIKELTINNNESITIDNLHFVAMEGNANYTIEKFGSLKSTIFGGEGLVVKVNGPAKIYIQTRNLASFLSHIPISK